MNHSCRIAFIGGGSLRTLGVIRDWVIQGEIAENSRVAVMDTDERRVKIIGGLARQMPEMRGRAITIDETTDLGEALEGADFVYNVIRVGGVDGLERDKRIGLKYGFHGHDDFGPSAAMIVLRTVPVALKIAAEMEKRCPKAWLLNFTNPVPFIVRAIKDFSGIRAIGLCGGDTNQLYDSPTTLGWKEVPCRDLAYRGVGIDHFSWSTELTYHGHDFYPELMDAVRKLDRDKLQYYCRMSIDVLELYGKWLSSSAHCFHWTHHDEMTGMMREHFEKIDLRQAEAREDIQKSAIDVAEKCLGKDLGEQFWNQEVLKGVHSANGFPALGVKVISSMLADRGEEMMVNMHAPGDCGNLQDDGILLVSAKLHRRGPVPLHFDGVPEGIAPLTRQILDYQKALVHAAVGGSRRDLETAIFMDPNMRDISKVRRMLDELLTANKGCIRPALMQY